MRYWVYLSEKVSGPYEPKELKGLPVFHSSVLVCPEGLGGEGPSDWRSAGEIEELSAPETGKKPDLLKLYEESLESLQQMSRDLEQARRIKAEPGMAEKIKKLQDELYESHKILEGMKINNMELERKLSAEESRFEAQNLERRREREDFEKEKKELQEKAQAQTQEMEIVRRREAELKAMISKLEKELKSQEAALASAKEAVESLHKNIREIRSSQPIGKAPVPPKVGITAPPSLSKREEKPQAPETLKLALMAVLFMAMATIAWSLYRNWPELAAVIEARLQKPEMIARIGPGDMEPVQAKPLMKKPPEIAEKPKVVKPEKTKPIQEEKPVSSKAEESEPIIEQPVESLPGLEPQEEFILPGVPKRKSGP